MSEESDLLATLSSLLSDGTESENSQETKDDSNEPPFDFDTILKLGSMLSDFNEDDNRARLLKDLKPFLSPDKRDKVDQTIKILKLLKIAEKAKNENLL